MSAYLKSCTMVAINKVVEKLKNATKTQLSKNLRDLIWSALVCCTTERHNWGDLWETGDCMVSSGTESFASTLAELEGVGVCCRHRVRAHHQSSVATNVAMKGRSKACRNICATFAPTAPCKLAMAPGKSTPYPDR